MFKKLVARIVAAQTEDEITWRQERKARRAEK